MINSIIKTISISLYNIFGNDYNVYTENVKQGFKEPCFFIQPIAEGRKSELSNMAKKRLSVDIMFFPAENNANEEIVKVLNIMLEKMRILFVNGKKIRGNDIDTQISDGMLHFIVNYDFHMITDSDIIYMQKLYEHGGIKNG